MDGLVTEKVPCCVCGTTGKLPRLIFWKKDCDVCDGTGERRIIMHAAFPERIKEQLRIDATYGVNRFRSPFEPFSGLFG